MVDHHDSTKPVSVEVRLDKANRGGFKKGIRAVDMPPLKDRYEDQWREFDAVQNGEMVNPYTYEHNYAVQKCHLEACGLPLDV